MKYLMLLILTTTLFAKEIYVDIARYSDDGNQTIHKLFKVIDFDINNNESISCEFTESGITQFEISMIKLSDVYLFNIEKNAYREKITDSFITASSIEDLLTVSMSTDGYEVENFNVGSKKKIENLNIAMSVLDEEIIDLSNPIIISTKNTTEVEMFKEIYKFSCEVEKE